MNKENYIYAVSVVIVNYNSAEYVHDSIKSIFAQSNGCSYEIIVVDNASPDGGLDSLKAEFTDQKVVFVESHTNVGFGGACNIGVSVSRGHYILFLNPDTILLNDAITLFYDFALSMPNEKFALGCCLLDANRQPSNSYHYFLSPIRILKMGLGKVETIKYEIPTKPFEVDFITGADLFVPRSVLERIGGFDEEFFMYCEDVDIQKRMKDIGVRRLIVPGPEIVHFDGGSYNKKKGRSARRRMEYDKSKLLYVKKHYSALEYCCFRIAFFFIRIPAFINPHYRLFENIKYAVMLMKRVKNT